MTGRPDLIQHAQELRQQAKSESDENIRDRLIRMADHYDHLAESQTWSEAHPPSVAALTEILSRRD